jgi:ribosomal protein S18 acetylase RimI-like enzyme
MKVRSYRAEDREAVRSICFETGLMGDPVVAQFGDKETFADLFTGYYTDKEPESCFVVEAADGKVVGYLVGTLDTRKAASVDAVMAKVAFTRHLGWRPATARFFWRGIGDSAKMLLRGESKVRPDLDAYPAHTHFSLLPEARQAPLAAGLYRAFFLYAKKKGCPGLHGEVFAENVRAAALHEAMGFKREGEPSFAPALRGPSGEALHIQLWTRKL